jgi:hypothetical protein
MFQDNGILKIGHSLSRKLLWLIPFMLAKKLLSLGDGQPVKVFVTARGTKAHTRRNAA